MLSGFLWLVELIHFFLNFLAYILYIFYEESGIFE